MMLAQWLVRMTPSEWHKGETPAGGRLATVYGLGTLLALAVATVMVQALSPAGAFVWFVAGWVTWSGIVALVVWRLVRRLDVSSPKRHRPALAGGQPDDEIVFAHGLSSGALVPYRRDVNRQRQALIRHIETDILISETPVFPREPRHPDD